MAESPARMASARQLWFIRALARDTGKTPEQWLREAKDDGARAPASTHQGYLARSDRGYYAMTAQMAGRLIAWMRLRQMRPTRSPEDPKPG